MGGRKKLFVALGLVMLALVLIVVVNGAFGGGEDRTYKKVASNLQNAWLHDNDMYFFSGSFFAKYGLQDNKIERLSDYLYISSGVESVSWSEGSVIFKADPLETDQDDITTAASQLGVKPYAPHWWRYDFQAKQYQLLDFADIKGCSSLVQVNESQLACSMPQSTGSQSMQIKTFNTSDKTSAKVASTDNVIDDVSTNGKSVFYVVTGLGGTQSLWSVDVGSGKNSQLYESDGLIDYYAGGKTVMVNVTPAETNPDPEHDHAKDAEAETISQQIIQLNGSQVTFDKTLRSSWLSFYSDAAGKIFLSSLNGSINYVEDGKLQELVGPQAELLREGDFLFKNGDHLFVLGLNNVLSASPEINPPTDYRDPSSFNVAEGGDNDPNGRYWVDTPSKDGSRNVYLFQKDVVSSQQELTVGDSLTSKGFRPSEFRFNWVTSGFDFDAPIVPRATAIR